MTHPQTSFSTDDHEQAQQRKGLLVSYLVRDGECRNETEILIDVATSVGYTHASHVSEPDGGAR